jgi:Glutamyl-tRNAGlu reductase, N-terminal domain
VLDPTKFGAPDAPTTAGLRDANAFHCVRARSSRRIAFMTLSGRGGGSAIAGSSSSSQVARMDASSSRSSASEMTLPRATLAALIRPRVHSPCMNPPKPEYRSSFPNLPVFRRRRVSQSRRTVPRDGPSNLIDLLEGGRQEVSPLLAHDPHGQLGAAYATAQAHQTTGPLLNRLCQAALHAGKRARAETGIASGAASMAAAAVQFAARHAGGLAMRRVLIVSGGQMGRAIAAGLSRQGRERVTVATRDPRRHAGSHRSDSRATRNRLMISGGNR